MSLNIIIPIGGSGEKFKLDGYTQPKPLIHVFGEPMIFYLIDNLFLEKDDNIIIIYHKEFDKYGFSTLLKNKYPSLNLYLISLQFKTEGATETVLKGLEQIDNQKINQQNQAVLLDCDTFYHIDILKMIRNTKNKNTLFSFKDTQLEPIYSYIKFDKQNIIQEIQEKVIISNYANTGCYCFESTHILKEYCSKVVKKEIKKNYQFYISTVIQEMMNNKFEFSTILLQIHDFTCVGTPIQLKIFCNQNFQKKRKRLCFDLDNTLLDQNKNIDFLRFLKKEGHEIIIYTSRGMKKHKGNISAIIQDLSRETFEILEKYSIPYDEIYFGKPDADFYIDGLGINSYDDLEKQMGFYKTSIAERDFNEIVSEKFDIIVKKSNKINKLEGEIYYYQNLPNKIKKYFPIFIDHGEDWYSIEKIKGITMSYIYVNESLSTELFESYLSIFREIHTLKKIEHEEKINIYDNYCKKIKERYFSYDYSKFENSKEVYEKLMSYFEKYERENLGLKGIVHGDSVFSNCLINEKNRFKLIDMRGKINTDNTLFGDIMYDYGKIYQSLIGYDEILMNRIVSNEYRNQKIIIFEQYIEKNYGKEFIIHIKMITNSLLFTLIPLHNNENCDAFYRLIRDYLLIQ
jgi:dTDP-glucose pyrophosphorylase